MLFKILNKRELCDLELLMNGGFSPLNGFMIKEDYKSVLDDMRLKNKSLFPIPICLSIDDIEKEKFEKEQKIILKDETGINLAYLYIEEIYEYDLEEECIKVFGCYDLNHPYQKIMNDSFQKGNKYYVGGKVEKIRDVLRYDFKEFRNSPNELKKLLEEKKAQNVVAFQTRNPMHKSHFHLTLNSLSEAGENSILLLHPVVGVTQDIDIYYHLRVICYKKLLKNYEKGKVILSLLPLSMRMAGPKEALWHSIIRKNYGATHFIIGRDHAGPSYKKQNGEDFYEPYEAQEIVKKYSDEIGIKIIESKMICYVKELDEYLSIDKIKKDLTILNLSGTQQRELLNKGEEIPDWFSFKEIIDTLKSSIKPKIQRGFCIYFIGIPASGKSTFANLLITKLKEKIINRNISLLDGDVIRLNLSKGLGFSKEDRETNIERIGFVASEIVKSDGICIVSNIAPFEKSRKKNRDLIEKNNKDYIEVYVKTSLEECIKRDPKGLYEKAKKGEIKNLTGYNDTFEVPKNCDVIINGENQDIDFELEKILKEIEKRNLI